jgi:hypothetical protein
MSPQRRRKKLKFSGNIKQCPVNFRGKPYCIYTSKDTKNAIAIVTKDVGEGVVEMIHTASFVITWEVYKDVCHRK